MKFCRTGEGVEQKAEKERYASRETALIVPIVQRDFQHLRKRYWGQHLWARGYCCATVGAVDEKTVMAYIESQKWDEDVDGFKVTAPTEP